MAFTSRIPKITRELKPAVEEGLRIGAELVAESARLRAPIETGALKASIHVEKIRGRFHVIAGDEDVFYGHLVENGTTHSAPQPFLIPALEDRRSAVEDQVRDAIRRAT